MVMCELLQGSRPWGAPHHEHSREGLSLVLPQWRHSIIANTTQIRRSMFRLQNIIFILCTSYDSSIVQPNNNNNLPDIPDVTDIPDITDIPDTFWIPKPNWYNDTQPKKLIHFIFANGIFFPS